MCLRNSKDEDTDFCLFVSLISCLTCLVPLAQGVINMDIFFERDVGE